MNMQLSAALQLAGRALLVAIFIRTGFFQFQHPTEFTANIAARGFPLPGITYYIAVLMMLAGGFGVLLGLFTRWAALALCVFCLITAIFVHYQPGDVAQMTNFYKNLGMAGGFLQLVALGAGAYSLDAKLRR